jgi:ATP-binding cassette subfamily B protein
MSRMTNDIDNISNTVSMALPTLFSGVLTIAGTVSVMLWFSWQLTLVACTTIVLTAISVSLLAGPVRRATRVRQELLGALNGKAEETISSYRTVVAYGQQARMGEEFERVSDQLTHSGVKAETLAGILNPVMNAVSNAGLILIVACGAAFALKGMLTVGVIAAFCGMRGSSAGRSTSSPSSGGSCRPPLRAPSVFLRFLTRQARTARAGIFAWSRARASSSRGSHSAMTRKSQ